MPKRLLTVVLVLTVFAFAKEFAPPPAQPAASYPMHETHSNEHLTIAVDPYDTPEKLAGAKVHYAGHDLLPLRFILTNDGDKPILLRDINIELITGTKDKIAPASMNDLLRLIANPDKNPDRTTRVTQWPVPKFGKPQRIKADQQDEINNLFFRVQAVEPHATQSGFLFFDVQGLTNPLSRSRLYITGIGDSNGNELLYFEIPLDKSATPQ